MIFMEIPFRPDFARILVYRLASGLEELDGIAVGIFELNLPAIVRASA
jgi:hypothetical protein